MHGPRFEASFSITLSPSCKGPPATREESLIIIRVSIASEIKLIRQAVDKNCQLLLHFLRIFCIRRRTRINHNQVQTMVTADYVRTIFTALASGDAPTFFNNVADNVSWRVTGTENPLSGQYNSKAEFVPATFQRLGKLMDGPLKLELVNVIVDGDMAAVELKANGKAKNGLDFANEYCWVCQFEGDKIVKVRAYLDSALVKRCIEENEK